MCHFCLSILVKYRFLRREIRDDKLVLDNERFDRLICASVSIQKIGRSGFRVSKLCPLPSFSFFSLRACGKKKSSMHVWK